MSEYFPTQQGDIIGKYHQLDYVVGTAQVDYRIFIFYMGEIIYTTRIETPNQAQQTIADFLVAA